MLHSICQQLWKTEQWLQDWKTSVFILIPKKGYTKERANYHTALISHASNVMLKIFQARLWHYMNQELPGVLIQSGLEKAEEQEIKLPTFVGSWRKQGSFRKTSTSASSSTLKPLTVWIPTNWKILTDGSTRPPYPSPEKSVWRSRSNS